MFFFVNQIQVNKTEQPWLMGRTRTSSFQLTSIHCSKLANDPLYPDEWEVPAQCIVIQKKLGEGEFGEVFQGVACGDFSCNKKLTNYSKQRSFLAVKMLKGHRKSLCIRASVYGVLQAKPSAKLIV